MTETEASRILERHARFTTFPAGSWRVAFGTIFGFGATRNAAIREAAKHMANQGPEPECRASDHIPQFLP